MKYQTTITSMTIHANTENPTHGDDAISISLDDEGSGSYLVLEELIPVTQGKVTINPEAWVLLKKAGDKLLAQKFEGREG